MKKLLLVAALLLLPLFASAEDAATLLTPDGTLYVIEPQAAASGANVHLLLTTRSGENIRSEVVPATLSDGSHGDAAMAYDPQSRTLFVLWLRQTGMPNSQLLVSSLDANGVWSEAIEFGNPFDYRENLRIAVTRKVIVNNDKIENGLTVHAAWWETDTHSGTESARYAVIGVENGILGEPAFLELADTILSGSGNATVSPEQLSVLRHPLLTPSTKQESVLVTFGDLTSGKLHRTRIYPVRPPVADGRIRIPVGRSEGSLDSPRFQAASNAVQELHGDNGGLALYVREGDKLRYVMLRDSQWSDTRTIALDDQITASAAVEAIRRLVNEH